MVEGLRMGDPLDEETQVTAIITESDAVRIEEWLKEATMMGAQVLCGGQREENRITPAVRIDVPVECRLYVEEAFATITVVSQYDSYEEALDIVNSGQFGLQTGVFTHDINKAMMAFNRLDVGGVIIDDVPTIRVDNYPYGGVKQSGFGREGVKYAMEELSELKCLVLPSPK